MCGAKNRELPEVTMKVFEKLTEAVTIEGLMLSYNEKGNEGTSKLIASRRKTKKKKLQVGGRQDL